ncbi:hypothetical protein LTR36_004684 [Oleoguttula mirabilis]|uniref:Uncharacterized protein n=1 Tax=Oleoguttula mirabilis TaxID=1507867 RepID=A0AAV9JFU2_9PEZI|nr:hypothetical protein LTR36_004684 [Oleoguttula mirabilis]
MPTYYALGISATLSVANLQASLSNVVDSKQGAEQRIDAQRISDVFKNARNLPERPIGEDGGEQGVQQFLGEREDMPFFMVEAGEGVRRKGIALMRDGTAESNMPVDDDADTDSPLTSLDATPSSGAAPYSCAHPPPIPMALDLSHPLRARQREPSTPAPPSRPFIGFERARGYLDQASGPQAMCLTIETCNRSFLLAKPDAPNRASGKDSKIEVFVNGQLAGISFINRRGAAIELMDNKVRFQGMRIHRQVEKPWIYDVEVEAHGTHKASADQRWHTITAALKQEANARGRNKWGDPSPSAELLHALADVAMPERIRGRRNTAIVDVVITAGIGRKHGPETGYVVAPTRMVDDEYSTYNAAADPFSDDAMLLDKAAEDASPLRHIGATALAALASSPDVPLIRQRSAAALPETPTKKQKTIDLTSELDLNNVNLKKQAQPFENSHGKTGQRGRTLKQRIGDIRKMNDENQQKQLAVLREELGENALRALKKEVAEDDEMQPSPSKKMKLDASCDFGLSLLADAALAGPDTIDPTKLWRTTPPPPPLPDSADPEAMLTQDRIDMALEAGAGFGGPLLRRIASSSPQRTPTKKTRASALANSPCAVPVKEQPGGKADNKTPTPQHRSTTTYFHNGSPIPIDPALTATPSAAASATRRSGRGANRTRAAWDPREKTAQDAMKAFKVPELCKGSVVTYGEEGGMQRQIGKARNGDFREETLVVGMRFVVV